MKVILALRKFSIFCKEGDCCTLVLAENIIPELSASALTKKNAYDYLRPYTIIDHVVEVISIIEIDIVGKMTVLSSPGSYDEVS
jgi:hypothetical protein